MNKKEKQKTAVEWLIDQIEENLKIKLKDFSIGVSLVEQAKAMEKEQKIKMLKTFLYNTQTGEDVEDVEGWFEQYETFKQQEQ